MPEAPNKLLALAHISGTEVPLIVDEVIHQIIVFRSNQVAPYIVLESILQTSRAPSCGSPIAGIAQHP